MGTPTYFALAGALLLAFAGIAWLVIREMRVVSATLASSIPETSPDIPYATLTANLAKLDEETKIALARLTKAVAEGIDHVDRNEKRVRGILTGARNRFASAGYEDPGVEAEIESLPSVDERERPEEELPAVSEDLELGSWGSVPGMKRS